MRQPLDQHIRLSSSLVEYIQGMLDIGDGSSGSVVEIRRTNVAKKQAVHDTKIPLLPGHRLIQDERSLFSIWEINMNSFPRRTL